MPKTYVLSICIDGLKEPIFAGSHEFCLERGEDWLETVLDNKGIDREDYDSCSRDDPFSLFSEIYYTIDQVDYRKDT